MAMTAIGTCTKTLRTEEGDLTIWSLKELERKGVIKDLARMPYSIRVLTEGVLRQRGETISDDDVRTVAGWSAQGNEDADIPWIPARVLLQDLTGGAAVTDLASMREAVAKAGKDPALINPQIPVDLVIDHSIQTDFAGCADAMAKNEALDFHRNAERYALFKWAQRSFRNFRAVPPGNGICHQVNLEYLSPLIHVREENGRKIAYPDSCFGTDSHTTQVDGLGVAGWGVGGIEAEAVMVGQPSYMKLPDVVGFRLTGKLKPGVTATDLVLTVVQMLRQKGVVGKFVEYCGPGYRSLEVADRATLANMAPEYGATMGFCPIDEKTLDYLRLTGRDQAHIAAVEAYAKEQGLWYDGEPTYSDLLTLDLSTVEPSLAGYKRPQDRIPLRSMKSEFAKALEALNVPVARKALTEDGLADGAVAIASITSCTNTANPNVMLAAGLLAKRACALGLHPRPYVKTSLAPGSRAVTAYLQAAGLQPYLDQLGFQVCGYGCMTCIGNSGPLADDVAQQIRSRGLVVAAVASSNRNFEGRIHPLVQANYLASPPLVIAYAIAGRVDIDLSAEPLATVNGKKIFLRDIWPTDAEIADVKKKFVTNAAFAAGYQNIFQGSDRWNAIECPQSALFRWDPQSTYIRNPPFFDRLDAKPALQDLAKARCLAVLGDSITTDHISPAGAFPADSSAGKYLQALGVPPAEFNSYGARRANHEVMVRGTFANIRLRNQETPEKEGGYSRYFPDGSVDFIFETAEKYAHDRTPLVVVAGKEYGTGSSRDWAAKGPLLLGVRAIIAQSFERIHRSNLVGMGIVPLQFAAGQSAASLGLDGSEVYDIPLAGLKPRANVKVTATKKDGTKVVFDTVCRADVPIEIQYLANGGILPFVLRRMAGYQ